MKVVMMGVFPVFPYQDKLEIIGNVPTHTTGWNVNLAKELAQMQDTEVHFLTFCTYIKRNRVIVDEGVIIHFMKVIPKMNLSTFSQYYKLKIKNILCEINPDIVTGIGTEHIYAFLAVVSGYPYVVSVQFILNDLSKYSNQRLTIRQRILRYYERYTLKRAKHIIVTTPYAVKSLKCNTLADFYVINNSIERIFFNSSNNSDNNGSNNAVSNKKGSLIFIGRMDPEKNVLTLIRSLKVVKDCYRDGVVLKILGKISEKNRYFKEVLKAIRSYKLTDNVNFVGFRNRIEVVQEIKSSNILVLPSLYEPFGMVLAEAMALGTPVVASNAAGIPYVVKDGETGFLVEPGDVKALAGKIMILLKDKELRRKMGEKGRQEARRRFHPKVVAKKTRAVYEKVLSDWRAK